MQLSYEFYGLRDQPFGTTPDPRYYYASAAHREVAASLLCGLEHGAGFAALISDPGMGKTMLLLRFLDTLGPTASTAFIFNTQCSSHDFLRNILDELHIPIANQDVFQMHSELKLFLVQQPRAVLIVIDEAQNLAHEVLETVRLLSDFEAPDRKLLHIVLAGQRQLAEKLSHPQLLQLQQRITIISKLTPLSPEETSEYLDHRLATAGYMGRDLFPPKALDKIAFYSHGVPRCINRICFNAILLGYAHKARVIGAEIIDDVMADLDLNLSWSPAVFQPEHSMPNVSARRPISESDQQQQGRESASGKGDFEKNTGVTNFQERPDTPAAPNPYPAPPSNPNKRTSSAPTDLGARRPVTRCRPHIPSTPPPEKTKNTVRSATVRVLLAIAILDATLGAMLLFWHFRSNSTMGQAATPSVESSNQLQTSEEQANVVPEIASSESPERPFTKSPARETAASIGSASINPASQKTATTSDAPEDPGSVLPTQSVPVVSMNGTGFTSETDVDPTIPQALASIPSQDSNLPPALGNGIVRVPTLSTPETPLNPQDTPIKTVKPVYPVLAKNSNIQGDVVVGFSIRKDGTIERAHVLRGNPILGLAALAAVQQWRYPPRYQEKYSASAASLERQITMKFNLSGR